jgi:hypothetical protein
MTTRLPSFHYLLSFMSFTAFVVVWLEVSLVVLTFD